MFYNFIVVVFNIRGFSIFIICPKECKYYYCIKNFLLLRSIVALDLKRLNLLFVIVFVNINEPAVP